MAYWVTRFTSGTDLDVTLPTAQPRDSMDEGEALSALLDLPRGDALDSLGSMESVMEPRFITVERLITAATAGGVRNTYDSLAAMKGRRGTLIRTPDGTSSTTQSLTARCLSVVSGPKTPRELYGLPVTMTWETWARVWEGDSHNESFNLTSTETNHTMPHSGNGVVRKMTIDIAPGGTYGLNEVYLLLDVPGHTCHLHYASSIAVGETVTIDVGSKSVTKDGSDAWDALSVTDTHRCTEWFRLAPSGVSNLIKVTRSGGGTGASVTFKYKDAWK